MYVVVLQGEGSLFNGATSLEWCPYDGMAGTEITMAWLALKLALVLVENLPI